MARVEDNIPEYSVSELAHGVRRTLESAFAHVRVRGEISGFKRYASGHGYFSLKDEEAAISAVMWRARLQGLAFVPEDGLEVVATGRVSAYPKNSRFQLIVERMEVAGVGALLKQVEERRRRLEAEGLFRREDKPPLPFIPRHIGVITSPQGAVIRDIMHRLVDRFPRRVTLWPVPVQGDQAAARITAAIRGFNAFPPDRRPDLLIVARGGGSIEDLMPFNDEALVRAAAASCIPLISAVGHETDTMLIDHAAALRAPTPTAAAELAVPVRAELVATIADLGARMDRARRRAAEWRHERLRALDARLPRASALFDVPRQRVDDAGARLAFLARQQMRLVRGLLQQAAGRLPTPANHLRLVRKRHEDIVARLGPAMLRNVQTRRGDFVRMAGRLRPVLLRRLLVHERNRLGQPTVTPNAALLRARLAGLRQTLDGRMRLIESLSPVAVMGRGYVLVRGAGGELLTRAADARTAGRLRLQFADGEVEAVPVGSDGEPVPVQGTLW